MKIALASGSGSGSGSVFRWGSSPPDSTLSVRKEFPKGDFRAEARPARPSPALLDYNVK